MKLIEEAREKKEFLVTHLATSRASVSLLFQFFNRQRPGRLTAIAASTPPPHELPLN
jgi:hypothetical protein